MGFIEKFKPRTATMLSTIGAYLVTSGVVAAYEYRGYQQACLPPQVCSAPPETAIIAGFVIALPMLLIAYVAFSLFSAKATRRATRQKSRTRSAR